jgi:hypothetical protein
MQIDHKQQTCNRSLILVNQIGYAGGDSPWVSLLNRMGTEEALRWTKECTADEKKDIYARMHLYEMQKKYPNPAQRLVENVKIAKWQRKQVLRMRYTSDGPIQDLMLNIQGP